MNSNDNNSNSLVSKVEDFFIDKIKNRHLKAGEKLPTVQEVHEELSVSYGVAASAIKNLSQKGYIYSTRGKGSFVCHDEADRNADKQSFIHSSKLIYHVLLESTHSFDHSLQISSGIQEEVHKQGLSLRTIISDERKLVEIFEKNTPKAVIMGTSSGVSEYDVSWEELRAKGIKLIYCGSGNKPDFFDSVVFDNYGGARLAVEHLIKYGHRNICFIKGNNNSLPYKERERAYQDAMILAGLQVSPSVVWHIYENTNDVSEVLRQIKKENNSTPTAFFVLNDMMAVEIIKFANLMNISIPAQLSIIGFENNYRTDGNDILSTVDFPKKEMGIMAIRMISELNYQIFPKPFTLTVPGELIEKQSVKKIRRVK